MAERTLYLTSSVSGNVSTPANALGTSDNTGTTDTGNTDWTHRWAFTPESSGSYQTSDHRFQARVQKDASGGGDPSFTPVVYVNSVSVTIVEHVATFPHSVTNTAYSNVEWRVALADISPGDTVEVELVTNGGGGGPNARCVQLDAILWIADHTTGSTLQLTGSTTGTSTTSNTAFDWDINRFNAGGNIFNDAFDINPYTSVNAAGIQGGTGTHETLAGGLHGTFYHKFTYTVANQSQTLEIFSTDGASLDNGRLYVWTAWVVSNLTPALYIYSASSQGWGPTSNPDYGYFDAEEGFNESNVQTSDGVTLNRISSHNYYDSGNAHTLMWNSATNAAGEWVEIHAYALEATNRWLLEGSATGTSSASGTLTRSTASDLDALAFIEAVEGGGDSLTNAQETAIDNLVTGLKTNSLWTSFDAIYPFIGGTATSHKWNLKNPLDTNAAYRLSYITHGTGTISHTANGMELDSPSSGNGGTAWTYYTQDQYTTDGQNFDFTMALYSPVTSQGVTRGGIQCGHTAATVQASGVSFVPWKDTWAGDYQCYFRMGSTGNSDASTTWDTNGDTRGCFIQTNDNTTQHSAYENGNLINGSPFNSGTRQADHTNLRGFGIGGILNGNVADQNTLPSETLFVDGDMCTGTYSFAAFGGVSLNATQAGNLTTVIESYQAELGRSALGTTLQLTGTATGTATTGGTLTTNDKFVGHTSAYDDGGSTSAPTLGSEVNQVATTLSSLSSVADVPTWVNGTNSTKVTSDGGVNSYTTSYIGPAQNEWYHIRVSIKVNSAIPVRLAIYENGVGFYDIDTNITSTSWVEYDFIYQFTDTNPYYSGVYLRFNGTAVGTDEYTYKVSAIKVSVTLPSATNIVGYWPLNGNAEDNSSSRYDGTEHGSPSYVAGNIDQAITLSDTVNDHVYITDNDAFTFASGTDLAFSGGIWINDDADDDDWAFYIQKREVGQEEWQLGYSVTLGGYQVALFNPGSSTDYISAYVPISKLPGWYHIAWTYDGSETGDGINIYINGELYESTTYNEGTYTGMGNTTSNLIIGRAGFNGINSPSTYWVTGELQLASLWNTELSRTDVRGLYFTESSKPYLNAQLSGTATGTTTTSGALTRSTASDLDALAFIEAVEGGGDSLTDAQETAIDNLVVKLKADGLWTKHDAIYPFVGGTATAHKWNLKDPQDLDASHRLTYSTEGTGSITHDANGMEIIATDGTNGAIASTHYGLTDVVSSNDGFIHFYSNKDITTYANSRGRAIVAGSLSGENFHLETPRQTVDDFARFYFENQVIVTDSILDDRGIGHYVGTTDGLDFKIYKNGDVRFTEAKTQPAFVSQSGNLFIGSLGTGGGDTVANALDTYHSSARYSFVGIGSADLTATDNANLYDAVGQFQKDLGRAYDPDAEKFIQAVESGGDTLTTAQKVAIDNLVAGLKNNSIWTKFDAIYPFIGGTSASHKWNLKDPLDTDAAFRLTEFTEGTGSVTHDSNGAKINSSSDTDGAVLFSHYYQSIYAGADDVSYDFNASIYSNADTSQFTRGQLLLGIWNGENPASESLAFYRVAFFGDQIYIRHGTTIFGPTNTTFDDTNIGKGFYSFSSASATTWSWFYNGSHINGSPFTAGARLSNTANDKGISFGAIHNGAKPPVSGASFFGSDHGTTQFSFASLGNQILSDTDHQNFNTVVEAYQVELGRNAIFGTTEQLTGSATGTATTSGELLGEFSGNLIENWDFFSATGWVTQNGSSINTTTGVATVIANGNLNATNSNWGIYGTSNSIHDFNDVNFTYNTGYPLTVDDTYRWTVEVRQTVGSGNFQVGVEYNASTHTVGGTWETVTGQYTYTSGDSGATYFRPMVGGGTAGDEFEVRSWQFENISTTLQLTGTATGSSSSVAYLRDFTDYDTGNNLVDFPSVFSDASWTKWDVTITNNSIVGPRGATDADTLTDTNDSVDTNHIIYDTVAIYDSSMLFKTSAFLKQGTKQYAEVALHTGSGNDAIGVIANLSTGTITDTIAYGSGVIDSSGIEDFDDGWYRVWIIGKVASTITVENIFPVIGLPERSTYSAPLRAGNPVNNLYIGDGTGTIYAWGAKLEIERMPITGSATGTSSTSGTLRRNILDDIAYSARFEEDPASNGGVLIDDVSGRNGTNNGASLTASGRDGNAWEFVSDGVAPDDYVIVSNTTGLHSLSAITVAVDFYPTTGGPGATANIFGLFRLELGTHIWNIGWNPSEQFRGRIIGTTAGQDIITTSGPYALNTWHRAILRWEANGTVDLNINGNAKESSAGTVVDMDDPANTESRPIAFGMPDTYSGLSGRQLNGRVDNAMVWTRRLEDDEVTRLTTGESYPTYIELGGTTGNTLQLTGSATGTATTSGSVTTREDFISSFANAIATTSGDLTTREQLSGSATGTATTSGAIREVWQLTGSTSATATTSGAITERLALSGTATGQATTSGALSEQGGLTGATTGTSSTSGSLTARMWLTGATNGLATTVGELDQVETLTGSATGTTTTSGNLTTVEQLSGTATGVATTNALLVEGGGLSGVAIGTSTTAGDLTAIVKITGAATGAATTAGDLVTVEGLSGSAIGSASTAGDLTERASLSGAATGVATTSGLLKYGGLKLTGSAIGTSSTSGNITERDALIGSAIGTSLTSADLDISQGLSGSATGVATSAGDLTMRAVLSGSAVGVSTQSAELSVGVLQLSGAATGAAVTSGNLIIGAVTSKVRFWDGTQWSYGTFKKYDGNQFVNCIGYYWDGSQWVKI